MEDIRELKKALITTASCDIGLKRNSLKIKIPKKNIWYIQALAKDCEIKINDIYRCSINVFNSIDFHTKENRDLRSSVLKPEYLKLDKQLITFRTTDGVYQVLIRKLKRLNKSHQYKITKNSAVNIGVEKLLTEYRLCKSKNSSV